MDAGLASCSDIMLYLHLHCMKDPQVTSTSILLLCAFDAHISAHMFACSYRCTSSVCMCVRVRVHVRVCLCVHTAPHAHINVNICWIVSALVRTRGMGRLLRERERERENTMNISI